MFSWIKALIPYTFKSEWRANVVLWSQALRQNHAPTNTANPSAALHAGQTLGGAGSAQLCSPRMQVPCCSCPIEPSCCSPPPQQLQLLGSGGKFRGWVPSGQEAAAVAQGGAVLGEAALPPCSITRTLPRPMEGRARAQGGTGSTFFRGAPWSSSCWMPALRSTVAMPINGRIPVSKLSSLPYKKQRFWLKCLLRCFSSFCCLTPQVTAPIIHIPEFLWLFSHQCNCRVVTAVFSTNSLLKNGEVRLIISPCWQTQ